MHKIRLPGFEKDSATILSKVATRNRESFHISRTFRGSRRLRRFHRPRRLRRFRGSLDFAGFIGLVGFADFVAL